MSQTRTKLSPLRRFALLALPAVLLFAVAAPSAVAAPESGDAHASKVTVRFVGSQWMFRGHVSSTRRCERRRKIVVFTRSIGSDTRVGGDRTNAAGRYRVAPNQLLLGADYYAVARTSGRRGACARGVSERFRLGA